MPSWRWRSVETEVCVCLFRREVLCAQVFHFPTHESFLHTAQAPSFWTTAGVCAQLCTLVKLFHPLLLLAMCPLSLLTIHQCLSLCILATSLKFRDWIEGSHQRIVKFESWASHLALQRAQGPCTRGVCCPIHELSCRHGWKPGSGVLGCSPSEWGWVFCVRATVYTPSYFSFGVLHLWLLPY